MVELKWLALAAAVAACATYAAASTGAQAQHNQRSTTAVAGPDSDRDGLSDDDEARRRTDPRRRDTDRDGLQDGAEVRRYHTSPRKSDTDRDGLQDGPEIGRYKTDPRRRDTDRDRLDDGDEIGRYRTNPRERDTDTDGWNDGAEIKRDTDPRNARSRPGFPREDNTGVPAGTTLTAYTGPTTIRTPNTVIDGKTMGCIVVEAPGVVIRNSKIVCPNSIAVLLDDPYLSESDTRMLIEDAEVDCQNQGGGGVGNSDFVLRRVNIHGCENGVGANQNVLIEDSYIHDMYNSAEAHTDGVQFGSGHWNGSSYVCCARNITIRHNTIYGMGADGSFGTSAIITNNPGTDENILIENNLLAGGAYALYCNSPGAGVNYRLINNRFSTRFKATVGFYGPLTDCRDETQSGSVYHETGKPVRLP